MDEPKYNAENNSLKALSLDQLGPVASKLRTCWIEAKKHSSDIASALEPLEDIISKGDIDALRKLVAVRKEISSHLSKRCVEDAAYDVRSLKLTDSCHWSHLSCRAPGS